MRVLLIDPGYTLAGLAAVRAFGQAGWMVGVGSPRPRGFALASGYAQDWHAIPSPVDGVEGFIDAINRASGEKAYDLVFAAGDAELLGLAHGAERIATRVPYSKYQFVEKALDKLTLAEAAAKVGVATPMTREVTEEALEQFDWPVVLKPRIHWKPGSEDAPSRLEAAICHHKADALARAQEIWSCGGVPFAQEFITGELMGFTAVTNRDCTVVAQLQQMAPLTWYPNQGMPTRAYTVAVDQDLAKRVGDLLTSLRWFGMVQLQFILPEDKVPRLIDFNGRTYASLALATAAGVNFLDIWARLAMGQQVEGPIEARPGVRYHWLEGDLKRSLRQRRGGALKDFISCIGYAPGTVGAVWAKGDPGPAWRFPGYLIDKLD